MSAAKDLTGQKFNKLTALVPLQKRVDKKVVWRFQCDCGNQVDAVGKAVVSGNTKSCGCLRAEAPTTSVPVACKVCGKESMIKPSRVGRGGTYCSYGCMAEDYKTRMTGDANPNYKGLTDADRTANKAASEKAWRAANPEKVAECNRNSRAQRRKSPGKHTAKDIVDLRDRQKGQCAACQCGLHGDGHVDHIIPIAKGGSNFVGNLQILCAQCNLVKKTMLPIEYRHRVLKGDTEDAEQSKVMDWAQENVQHRPDLSMLFHAANGGYRTKATAVKMQALGVKKGVPDLHLLCPKGGFHGLFIEMKVGRNKPTPEQAAWLAALNMNGYKAVVCYGAEAAKSEIENYLDGRHARAL